MRTGVLAAVLGVLLVSTCSAAADEGLEAGFRSPPDTCRAAPGWFLSKVFLAGLAKCPGEVKAAFERAVSEGGLSVTPEEVRRMASWQALADATALVSARPDVEPFVQPYEPLAKPLADFTARIVYLCSKTEPVGGVFTHSKTEHGLAISPPAPGVYLARRKLADADIYFVSSQVGAERMVTIAFPRLALPELWDPEDGSIRPALTYFCDEKATTLNLRLGPYQAVFIGLAKPPTPGHVMFAPALRVTEVAPDGSEATGWASANGRNTVVFSSGKMAAAPVASLPPPLEIADGWSLKTQKPAAREGVGIASLRMQPADLDSEQPDKWAAPDFDDSRWKAVEIGKAPTAKGGVPWQAEWLKYDNDPVRFFRKAFDLAEEAGFAQVSASADNGYELFLNGARIGARLDRPGDWTKADTFDIKTFLRKGANVLAARNTNANGPAGFLMEARIRLASGKLVRVVSDDTWRMAKTAPADWEKPEFDDRDWDRAVSGGRPPVGPWGEVTGLPPDPASGQVVWYRFRLPAGAKSLSLPAGLDKPRLYVGGKEVAIRDGGADLAPAGDKTPVGAALRVAGGGQLDKPIQCDCSSAVAGVGPWLLIGYPKYSGLADYAVEVALPEAYLRERLVLDLGEVGCAARVSVNGTDVGTRLWRPYTFEITRQARAGKNEVRITVANTAANASGKNLPAERLAAGLAGPVRVLCLREVKVRAATP